MARTRYILEPPGLGGPDLIAYNQEVPSDPTNFNLNIPLFTREGQKVLDVVAAMQYRVKNWSAHLVSTASGSQIYDDGTIREDTTWSWSGGFTATIRSVEFLARLGPGGRETELAQNQALPSGSWFLTVTPDPFGSVAGASTKTDSSIPGPPIITHSSFSGTLGVSNVNNVRADFASFVDGRQLAILNGLRVVGSRITAGNLHMGRGGAALVDYSGAWSGFEPVNTPLVPFGGGGGGQYFAVPPDPSILVLIGRIVFKTPDWQYGGADSELDWPLYGFGGAYSIPPFTTGSRTQSMVVTVTPDDVLARGLDPANPLSYTTINRTWMDNNTPVGNPANLLPLV